MIENTYRHLAALLLAVAFCLQVGCGALPQRNPLGERFPAVVGESLAGDVYQLPDDLLGEGPVLLLVGYRQSTQFDIDRWLFGLQDAQVPVPVFEVPTIRGMGPGLFARSIDQGMRTGIPREMWGAVITVYGDAGRIATFTGTEVPGPARVLLLDATGRVSFYHDEGYSVDTLLRLKKAVMTLRGDVPQGEPVDALADDAAAFFVNPLRTPSMVDAFIDAGG